MSTLVPRSVQFRREREAGWLELEALVDRVEKRGPKSLSPEEMGRLPMLYRAAISSLSVARAISLDRSLQAYLESLAGRAYLCVYGTRPAVGGVLLDFLIRDFPAAVRSIGRHVALAALLMLLGALAGFTLTLDDPGRYSAFVPAQIQGGRTPASTTEELREVLYAGDEHEDDLLWGFASYLFQNNARIGLLCFVLGVLFGLPVIYLLFSTGLMLGGFAGLYHLKGLSFELWGWLLPHGITELGAVVLCGAAGLALGEAVLLPGPRSRLRSLATRSRRISVVALGAVLLFLIAGAIEGVFRQRVQDDLIRYAVALGSLLLWGLYFGGLGRGSAER